MKQDCALECSAPLPTSRCRLVEPLIPRHGDITLQSLVTDWQTQAQRHALTTAPKMLLIQIARYRHTTAGPSKDERIIRFEEHISVELFTSAGMACEMVRYQITAVIQHQGESTNCGHYTSALMSPGEIWFSNDGISAVLSETIRDSPLMNEYLIFLSRYGEDAADERGSNHHL